MRDYSRYLDKIVEGSLYLVILLPLFFMPFFWWDFYNLPKVTLLRFITLVILGGWLLRTVLTGKLEFRRTPLDLPLLTFTLFLLLSTIFSTNPTLSIVGAFKRHEGFSTWLSYFLLYFAATNFLKSRKQKGRFFTFFIFFSIPVSLYGIFQHFGLDFIRFGKEADINRSFSTLGNPVFLGAYLTAIIPLALAFFLKENLLKKRVFLGIALSLAFVCLIYTYGRGAWIGTGASLIFLAVFLPKKILKLSLRRAVLLVTFILFVLVVALVLPSPHPTAKLAAQRAKSLVSPGEGSIATRLEIWKNTLSLIKDRPLLGWGLETFGYIFPKYRSFRLVRLEGEKGIVDRPHNEILYLVASVGFLGLLPYFWVILAFLKQALRLLRMADLEFKIVLSGAVAAFIGYQVQAEFSFSLVGVTPLIWVLMGLIMGTSETEGDNSSSLIMVQPRFLNLSTRLKMALTMVILIFLIFLGYLSFQFLLADHYYQASLTHSSQRQKVESLNRAIALNPYQNFYRLELGRVYYQRGIDIKDQNFLNQAIAVYNESLRLNPRDKDILYNLGNVYSFLGSGEPQMFGLALKNYLKAVEIDPLFSKAHWSIGFIYFQKNDFKKGIKHYEKAVKIVPANPFLRYDIGLAYEDMGEVNKAKLNFRRALSLKPGYKKAREALNRLEKD